MSEATPTAFVDTNIFIRYFTKDDEKKAEEARNLFLQARKGKIKLVINIWVLAEIEFILRRYYHKKKEEILPILRSLFTVKGLTIDQEDLVVLTLNTFEKTPVGFVDCMNFAFMKQRGIQTVYSYDDHFDEFKELKRSIP